MSGPGTPDPRAEGERAASGGGATESNPYPAGTEEHAKWREGYEGAVDADEGEAPADFA